MRNNRDDGPAALVRLVATGQAESRAELARLSGLAASSVSLRVEQLIEAGLFAEEGAGASRGGRRPRRLRLARAAGVLLIADLGAHHARLAVADLAGAPLALADLTCDIAVGPEKTLTTVLDELRALARDRGLSDLPVRGVGIGLPGPVDPATGQVVSPSRMPGWNDFPVRDFLAGHAAVPVLVENDANLMAVGEHRHSWPELDNLMVIKLGTGIGCGVIVDGRLHRGRGAAGDISHVRILSEATVDCSCGHPDCLEAHASGAALAAALAGQGIAVDHPSRIVELVTDGVPQATSAVRTAGRLIGDVLTALVNFFNPDALVIGGSLSGAEPLVATVRGAIYERCLPLATRNLEIATSRVGRNASILGAGHLLLDASGDWIEQALDR
ncbi:ROK family protein [Actinomadura kijaniata]|uniref:Putative NBD/HSP70 family sugar kinase n=1 Tax=Actinomadura namibiensis TaxID=182080 RepID=A0A7W3QS00_ACTNM|nr:ROK family protein [Actinomadura namibiensis]MBA8957314.1 putative NBD/HSP70 family sugar kinase [Actinomadura namibiensis]